MRKRSLVILWKLCSAIFLTFSYLEYIINLLHFRHEKPGESDSRRDCLRQSEDDASLQQDSHSGGRNLLHGGFYLQSTGYYCIKEEVQLLFVFGRGTQHWLVLFLKVIKYIA